MLTLKSVPTSSETLALAEQTAASTRPGLLADLLRAGIIDATQWDHLTEEERRQLGGSADRTELLSRLARHGLVSPFQAAWLRTGTPAGLVLGSHVYVDRLSDREPATLFRAVHGRLRRPAVIKRVPLPPDREARDRAIQRLDARLQQVGQLRHPGVPHPIDCGLCRGDEPAAPFHHFQVMDLVPGQDLQRRVQEQGPLSPEQTCDVAYQLAGALEAMHRGRMVHHAVWPAHTMLTPEGQVLLLGAGVPDSFRRRPLPEELAYRAPEADAESHDLRADLYGLGATLFWCLTARPPFAAPRSATDQGMGVPPLRTWRPDAPAELDALVTRLLAPRPADRYPTARAVMTALAPLLSPKSQAAVSLPGEPGALAPCSSGANRGLIPPARRVLVAVTDHGLRDLCKYALRAEGISCDEAGTGPDAVRMLSAKPYDVMLLHPDLQGLSLRQLGLHLHSAPSSRHLKIIHLGRKAAPDQPPEAAADREDVLPLPVNARLLVESIQGLLRFKESQDRADLFHRHLLAMNRQLEEGLAEGERTLRHARRGLAFALAKLVACRDAETGAHLLRMQRYCRRLAEAARDARSLGGLGGLSELIDAAFLDALDCAVPLHDIGKIGLPDYVLFKSAALTPEERRLLERHPQIGADLLREVGRQHGPAYDFLPMAIAVARHHHERYDGAGYPDRLAGQAIPLAARIVTVADVYDALRSRRPYKPAQSHAHARQVMIETAEGQFDPMLFQTFRRHAADFERIYQELTD